MIVQQRNIRDNTMLRTAFLNPQFPYSCILVLASDQVLKMFFTPMTSPTRFSIEHFAFTLPFYSSTKDGVE